MTIRLSQSSLTGTDRTDVAVGTVSESSMFATVRAGAPRSTVYVGWSLAAAGAGAAFSFGTGRSVPLAGSAALLSGRGVARGAGARSVDFVTLAGAGAARSVAGWAGCAGAFAGVPLAGGPPLPGFLKYAAQVGSTLPGSRVNWSYISSTSHSLAPKSVEGSSCEGSDGLVCCGTGAFASSGTCAWMSSSAVCWSIYGQG